MLFNFNLYSSLLLPFVLQGFLYFILFMVRGWRESRLADKLFGLLILLFTFRVLSWMLGFAGWYDTRDWHTTFMFYFHWNFWYAFGPLLWFYFRSSTNRNFKLKGKDWLHFLPEAIMFGVSFIIFFHDIVYEHWMLGQALPHFEGTKGTWYEVSWGRTIITILTLLQLTSIIGYFSYTLREYHRYRVYLVEHFSETEQLEYKWLRNFMWAFIAAQLIWLVFMLANEFLSEGLTYIQEWYAFAAWGLIIYYISIGGYKAHPSLDLPLEYEPEIAPDMPVITEPIAEEDEWKSRLQGYMEKAQPYLHTELTLTELARQLNTSSSTLSKAINANFNQNFNDYVNSYRVEAVKEKLQDEGLSHLSLLGIAYECGFRSKATFNRAFKKHTNISPSAFQKQLVKV